MAESCMAVLFHTVNSGSLQFLNATISQGSVATRLSVVGYLITLLLEIYW